LRRAPLSSGETAPSIWTTWAYALATLARMAANEAAYALARMAADEGA
jgi:hypothetical protein